nr:uncharacterized protein LOC112941618 isoform X1 [Solanum lycopersicum]
MGRFIKEQPTLDFEGRRNQRDIVFCYSQEPVADCHQTSFMEVHARHCVLIMKTPLYFSNGAEHYSPPWFSVAPMMKWTDNQYRTLACLILRKTWLYPEMLADETTVYQSGNLFVVEAMCIIAANTNVPVSMQNWTCDEKYLQFQVDDLPYSCPTCRGDNYKSINLNNAVPELWKRRDVADGDLIATLRAGAGLPVDDEIFSISPFSEDENSAPLVDYQHKLSLKFSPTCLVDKYPQKSKECGKDSGEEKGLAGQNGHPDALSGGYIAGDVKNDELQAYGELNNFSSPVGSLTEGICSFNEAGIKYHKFIDEVTENMDKRTVQRNDSKPQHLDGDDVGIQKSMPKISKGPNDKKNSMSFLGSSFFPFSNLYESFFKTMVSP